jgi:hypothetical protein
MAPTPLLQAARAAPVRRPALRARRGGAARAAVAAKPLRAPRQVVCGSVPAAAVFGRGAALTPRGCVAARARAAAAVHSLRSGAAERRLTRLFGCALCRRVCSRDTP